MSKRHHAALWSFQYAMLKIVDAQFQDMATTVLFAIFAITPTNTFTLEGYDNAAP